MAPKGEPLPIEPELGDRVIVPGSAALGGRVAIVTGFRLGRPIVALASNPNLTVALSRKQRILPEYCVEHADCRENAELAVECARSASRR